MKIAALALPPAPTLPGVPPCWCEGIGKLATMPPPASIPSPRWVAFKATAARLLHGHGAELHAAGWAGLDVWGLHATAPVTNPAGWGLAWLLCTSGVVLDVAPDVVGLSSYPGGNRTALRPRASRGGVVVLAWNLPDQDRVCPGLGRTFRKAIC